MLSNRSYALRSKQSLGLVILFVLGLLPFAQAAEIDLQAQMSAAEYRAAGIDRLTDAERAALEGWLAKHGRLGDEMRAVGTAEPTAVQAKVPQTSTPEPTSTPVAPVAADFGDEQLEKKVTAAPEVISAQIAGSFSGWDGKTVFRLTNGQIWKQRVGGRYRYRAEDPEVQIERARFGYYLKIVATGRKVGVKRIR